MKKGWVTIFKPFEGDTIGSYSTSQFIFPTKEEAIDSMGNNYDLIVDTIQISFNEDNDK